MSKRIVYCSDGTWQNAMSNTNVYRLYKALLVNSDQVTIYDDGVGADATGFDRILGGAIGAGLTQKVQDAYTKIAHLYEPGDQIYLFGFSRGAYTARSLGGMIANCGLPSGSFTDDCVTQAYAAYRDRDNRATILAGLSACGLADATITMIGCWDTVGSMGIPALFGGIAAEYEFLDLKLHPDVKHAYHSLAIDEHRAQFPATLWDPLPPTPPGQTPTQTLEQVWFSGCHGDVGGGTVIGGPVDNGTRLCDVSLGYMLSKAIENGLAVDPGVAAQLTAQLPQEDALDIIRESWAPKDGPVHLRPIVDGSSVSNSVAIRIQYALTYQPGNLTITDGALADSYNQVTLVDINAL
jgi:uncharacterized protein (DUF2235 family)